MNFNVKEDIIQLTGKWNGERFDDGRPRVPDKDLDILRSMTLEEVWQAVFAEGYHHQFVEELKHIRNTETSLVGRAVTSAFLPARPDMEEIILKIGADEGRKGTCNQWVVESLTVGDVLVADMYDKIYEGTFIGGNLSTAVMEKTKTGGAVIWGGVRDVQQMVKIENLQVYFRGIDPTPIRNFVMGSFNAAVRIGGAVCLPGDIVYGCDSGVIFIPCHLVKKVIEGARKSHVKDIFGFQMLEDRIYTTADIDVDVWPLEMMDRFVKFIQEDERAEEYRDLCWDAEYRMARSGQL